MAARAPAKNNVVPFTVAEAETPRYFTLPLADYPEFEAWLTSKNFTYNHFFASFINYAIKLAQRRNDQQAPDKAAFEFNKIFIFEERDNTGLTWEEKMDKHKKFKGLFMPVQCLAFTHALADYATEVWKGGVTSGPIDLTAGRVADSDELEVAQRSLAQLLWPAEERRKIESNCPEFGWLVLSAAQRTKAKKKTTRKAAKKAMEKLEGLDLGEETKDDGEAA